MAQPRLTVRDYHVGWIRAIAVECAVVSSQERRSGGVLQYDYGKTIQNRQFEVTGSLDKSSRLMLQALQKLSVQHERRGHAIAQTIELMTNKSARLRTRY
ncbi:uncharacterized protein A1O5_11713 [Cladophialophora psammophila CBS 110553]|uniref:Uncharacterized protein n=1 Tax=Cladophialophora psammophila CBS 110553 TaxID=1182543 RepID=W9W0E3_9EURO|nr:uncharacterized protein A1O5_11713 [Cladophialophora psammophila CBS 110553]EXJ61398.1 hypothetical protein A1O5_11713 [Cladophialophora psammophila CBS 110553]